MLTTSDDAQIKASGITRRTTSFACKVDGGEVFLDAAELATLALDAVPPKAGPGAASAGAIGDATFDVQTPHSA